MYFLHFNFFVRLEVLHFLFFTSFSKHTSSRFLLQCLFCFLSLSAPRQGYRAFRKYFPEGFSQGCAKPLSQKLYGISKYLPWALQLSKNTILFSIDATVLLLCSLANTLLTSACVQVRAWSWLVCVNSLVTPDVLLRRFVHSFHSTNLRDAKSVGNAFKTRSKCVCICEGPLSRSLE